MDNNLGNKHTMAENIKYYMELYGKTRKEMCEVLNVPYTTFTSWIKEQNYPRIDKIEKMAQVFKITKADLVEERVTNKNEKQPKKDNSTRVRKKGVKIPVLGEVVAGVPIEAIEDILDYEEITEEMAAKGEHFALKVKGDSMEPVFYAEDIVIVRQQAKTENSIRKLKVPPYILNLIEQLPEDQEYLVPTKSTTLSNQFRRHLIKCNVPHIAFHDLRHLAASVMLQLNVPEKYAMERGGWSTDSTLKNVYQHTFSPERQRIDQAIDNYFENIL